MQQALDAGRAERRWAGLHGVTQGEPDGSACPIVLLHGLTFDHRMWIPVLSALPAGQHAIAFDLPGHGGSPAVSEPGLEAAVAAIHEAVVAAELGPPVMAGHSIGGPLAAIYGSQHPVAAVVSVDAPIRIEPFAPAIRAMRPQLAGDGFAAAWAPLQDSMHMERLAPVARSLVSAGDRPGDERARRLVLAYQADLLDRPLEDVVRWHESGLERLRAAGTPYVSLHADALAREDREWLTERIPHAEVLVWPTGHHFPHLSEPGRFADLLTRLAADDGE